MSIEETARKIEELEIQGATRIAIEAVNALQEYADEGASDRELEQAAEKLLDTRPTEPALQNAVASVLEERNFEQVLDHFQDAKHAIADEGASLLQDGSIVYTHCHSSTVAAVLRHAKTQTDFTVRNTETRPVYQGRTTAEELATHGIEVEHYVDAAAKIALENADIMLIGADAITWQGDVYNKVGSG
ncbi:MAG: hypothetical protein SVU32_02440, partial [Candidatus Nanohaloarchaea archaeon]|nr:hypothetical protein [Candidatus Nanohaloarchaea archaeon]